MLLAAPFATAECSVTSKAPSGKASGDCAYLPGIAVRERLIATNGRQINVAFAINPGVQVIDVAGPWEVFEDTYVPAVAEQAAFKLYTVSETLKPLRGSGV